VLLAEDFVKRLFPMIDDETLLLVLHVKFRVVVVTHHTC
jgi:hypothetical protein